MGRGRARGGQGSLARVVPEFGRAGRSVRYGWSAVATRPTMRAGRDVREEVGTVSFTPASLFVALVLPMLPPIAHPSGPPSSASSPFPYPYRVIGNGDDSFCGGSHVRQIWDGCHLNPPERHPGKPEAPIEERHTGFFLLLLRFLRSCAWCGCRCTRFSACGDDLQDPRHTGFSPENSREGSVEVLRYAVEWSRGRGAYCCSCFAGGCPWPAPATRRYLTISKLRLRNKRKKRWKCSLGSLAAADHQAPDQS